MTDSTEMRPVQDTVAMVDNEVAVGEDLPFQRKWWKFENAVWIVFLIIILLDLLGVFGRGYFAKAKRTNGSTMYIAYERVERVGTPSILRVSFESQAIQAGKIQLAASESLVKALGAHRIIPQPAQSVIGKGQLLYSFPASNIPAAVEMELEPVSPGIFHVSLCVPGSQPISMRIVVMP